MLEIEEKQSVDFKLNETVSINRIKLMLATCLAFKNFI